MVNTTDGKKKNWVEKIDIEDMHLQAQIYFVM